MVQPSMHQVGRPLRATFYDSYVPHVNAGLYRIDVDHTIDGNPVPDSPKHEFFEVRAPRFTLDTTLVDATFPAANASGDFSALAPHLTITQELLPWERRLGEGAPATAEPWLALLLLRDDETTADRTLTVKEALTCVPGTAVPALTGLTPAEESTSCRIVELTAETFDRIAPHRDELPYLVHAREVEEQRTPYKGLFTTDDEEFHTGSFAVTLANRLPTRAGPHTAHLVSLEGCAAYFEAAGRPTTLRLVSLYAWTFHHAPSGTEDFATRLRHLAASGPQDPQVLSLRLPGPTTIPGDSSVNSPEQDHVQDRLDQGYVPVDYATLPGESTFAWYRGPFTPTRAVTQPWQQSGGHLPRPDAALIYERDYGVYDISYATAWTLGRLIVLADANLAAPLQGAYAEAARIAHRAAAAYAPPFTEVQARHTTGQEPLTGHRLMDRLMGEGLGERLLADLTGPATTGPAPATPTTAPTAHAGTPAAPPTAPAGAPESTRAPHTGRPAEARPERPLSRAVREAARTDTVRRQVREAVARRLGARDADTGPAPRPDIDAWTLLCEVPFHYLIPDARLLPAESLRFFHLDRTWLAALVDGALSVGVATTLDATATEELRQAVARTADALPCGMLLRSQVLQECPGLLVTADKTTGPTPGPVVTFRRDLGSNVWLYLFADIPDRVTLAEPCHGLHFGIDGGDTIGLRHLKGDHIGASIDNTFLHDVTKSYFRDRGTQGVMNLTGPDNLRDALARALHQAGEYDRSDGLTSTEFSMQCIDGAQQMTFLHSTQNR
ncbi:hypothetical protein [Streptomyces griseus]|uniref:hypothetical protein n=1 Tax=Streptomyces griseus TaxID=1911 RepID=UPI003680354C